MTGCVASFSAGKTALPGISPPLSAFDRAVYNKVIRRLIPFLFLCYVFAYIDRVNVGFAKLQMQQDLGMSDTVYGTGAGIFFVRLFSFFKKYLANMALQKIGAKYWLGPIMIVWGVVSGCTMFVEERQQVYAIPIPTRNWIESGVLSWCHSLSHVLVFPRHVTGPKMVAAVHDRRCLSPGSLVGPISGWLLGRDVGGRRICAAWQWLFLFEALPSMLAGLATLAGT